MKRWNMRPAAALLAGAVLLALLSITALAAPDQWTEVGPDSDGSWLESLSSQEGGNFRLTGPVAVSPADTVNIYGPVTLDLNGQTITWTSTALRSIRVESGGSLTIQDSGQGGRLELEGSSTYGLFASSGGSIALEGGVLRFSTAKSSGHAVYSFGGWAMSGGTVAIAGTANYGISLGSSARGRFTGGSIDLSQSQGKSLTAVSSSGDMTIEALTVDASGVDGGKP